MIERCGDRQRKCDGLNKWPFHLFVESLPVMLQISLMLLACGLCRHMASINATVAGVIITLTVAGVLFYLGIIIAGTPSYECPFQTPVSTGLRSLWKKIGPHITTTFLPVITAGAALYKNLPWSPASSAMHHFWEGVLSQYQTIHTLLWSSEAGIPRHFHNPSLPTTQPTPQQPTPWSSPLYLLLEDIQCKILHVALCLPSFSAVQTGFPITVATSTWFPPTALATLQTVNANDVRCVSWILWNITDPEALNAAIRLTSTIRWFEDGLYAEPPYDLIISALKACFDSTGKIYPGLRDRAYQSAQAVLWIHICAMCVSEEFANRFHLPAIPYSITSLDDDLEDLLEAYGGLDTPQIISWVYSIHPRLTPAYLQWTSNALLYLCWARRSAPDTFNSVPKYRSSRGSNPLPLNVVLNRLLACCILLGWPVEQEVLKIQDKSYVFSCTLLSKLLMLSTISDCFDQILSQFSQAMCRGGMRGLTVVLPEE